MQKIVCTNGGFCHLVWKMPLENIRRLYMDHILVGFIFLLCYINNIIIFNLILKDHMHHLQEMFDWLKEHNFKLNLGKC